MISEDEIVEAIENVNSDWQYDLSSMFVKEVAKSIIDKIRENENIKKIKSIYEVNSPEGEFGMG